MDRGTLSRAGMPSPTRPRGKMGGVKMHASGEQGNNAATEAMRKASGKKVAILTF